MFRYLGYIISGILSIHIGWGYMRDVAQHKPKSDDLNRLEVKEDKENSSLFFREKMKELDSLRLAIEQKEAILEKMAIQLDATGVENQRQIARETVTSFLMSLRKKGEQKGIYSEYLGNSLGLKYNGYLQLEDNSAYLIEGFLQSIGVQEALIDTMVNAIALGGKEREKLVTQLVLGEIEEDDFVNRARSLEPREVIAKYLTEYQLSQYDGLVKDRDRKKLRAATRLRVSDYLAGHPDAVQDFVTEKLFLARLSSNRPFDDMLHEARVKLEIIDGVEEVVRHKVDDRHLPAIIDLLDYERLNVF